MFTMILVAIIAFFFALIIGPFAIRWLTKMKLGQTIYDLGPQSHMKKQGTPTMGGVIFALPAVVMGLVILFTDKRDADMTKMIMVLICAYGYGLIGFVDDFIKVSLKRHEGLTPKQKLIPQIVISIGLSIWAYLTPAIGSSLTVPFFNVEWNLGWAFIPVMTFILVGTVNSANLLDGLDGLLSGCSLLDFAAMAVICFILYTRDASSGLYSVGLFSCVMAGALLGFLKFNAHPARVFMGDVGSFIIGGALVGITMVTRLSLLLPVIALAMMVSSLSDIIQIGYFKLTHGKRVFKMAPLHHHFELSGMPETSVTTMYHLFTAVLCLAALLGFVK